jgi:predicted MFS family arabinose efflux permease
MPTRSWLTVWAVSLGTFSVVTVENLPMGLLTSIGDGLRVSDGAVGLLVTVTGLVAALTALAMPVLIRQLNRRTVLIALISLSTVANAVSALAPNYAVLVLARFLVGVSIGGFWSLAAGLAVRLVSGRHVARATSLIFFGAMVANVLGVPAGTLIGSVTSWRVAFVTFAAIGVLLLIGLAALLPSMPATEPVRVATLLAQFRSPVIRVGVLATFLLVSGHYTAFTFVSPALQDISGIGDEVIGPLLLGFGVAGTIGNSIAGTAAGRNVRRTLIVISLGLAAVLAVFPLLGRTQLAGAILVVLWGLAFGGLPVSVQTWIIKAAPGSIEAATGLNTCVFNLAIALGALLGSCTARFVDVSGVLWIGAVLVALTPLAVWRNRRAAAQA